MVVPGLVVATAGVAVTMLAHRLFPQVGLLTWAVLLGVVAVNLGMLPASSRPGLRTATKRTLRLGVVLLGLSLSLDVVASLGLPLLAVIVTTLFATLVGTTWLGRRMGVGRSRSLLIGTGFAICGASAIAAMEEPAEADADDVAAAVTMVTLFGTIAMLALPLLQRPLGLTDIQLGVWAGAGVHEVGQVVGAASPAGAAAVATAVAVKLTRVLLLAPVVATVSMLRRRALRREDRRLRLPPLVPPFVVGFAACVLIRSAELLPHAALSAAEQVQQVALAVALFGMGSEVRVRSLLRGAGRALAVSTASTVVVAGVSLAGVLLVA